MKCPGCGVDLMGGMKECPKCKYDTRYPGGGEKYRKYKEEQFNAAQAKAREEEDKARAAERRVTAQMDAYYSMIANIDYVTIGWNVPLPRSKYIQNLRLSASVNNLATITGYSGLTPIINSNIVNSTLGVDDKRGFPVYRSYTVGISIQF